MMKFVFLTLAALFTASAFGSETLCTNNSNSDYELRLVFNGETLVQLSQVNQDWGGAGFGDLQPVSVFGENEYKVDALSGARTGLHKDDVLKLKYGSNGLESLDVFGEPGSPNGDSYSCSL